MLGRTISRLPKCRANSLARPSSVSYSTKKKEKTTGDPRVDIIQQALYPTHKYRPNLAVALQHVIPSAEAHETIERAWALHQRESREARKAELGRLYDNMRRAMDELEKTDEYLFTQANLQRDPRGLTKGEIETLKGLKGAAKKAAEARIEGFFPRELRIPTDTPRKAGWDHSWKAHTST
ncbi:hypothetical protein BOTBODRAFT_33137 [Botryobasidium botryosum FD-172 SS1]|uniref:Large ribosomal subunit protein mL40 n=1 Tax=Botryobasidium botryosum (strain FD-172 SS1) TaxID=930990 RepID=A0A067ME28_BOTB1|nr:hypothetical protein BOTBODRAFT_33137 [Botryobasidium botryosum FD-172 SS1]